MSHRSGQRRWGWKTRGHCRGIIPDRKLLTVTINGSGTVVSDPAGISCPGYCSATFAKGVTVQLTATPASGWVFSGWSGAVTGTANPVAIVMDADKSVTATFAQQGGNTAG